MLLMMDIDCRAVDAEKAGKRLFQKGTPAPVKMPCFRQDTALPAKVKTNFLEQDNRAF
jgi:hypothetical protein